MPRTHWVARQICFGVTFFFLFVFIDFVSLFQFQGVKMSEGLIANAAPQNFANAHPQVTEPGSLVHTILSVLILSFVVLMLSHSNSLTVFLVNSLLCYHVCAHTLCLVIIWYWYCVCVLMIRHFQCIWRRPRGLLEASASFTKAVALGVCVD